MFEGSIKALQAALTVALDQAERFHADVAKSNLRAQQTVGRQLEEHTIPSLKRLLEAEDAFGGIPALKRTAGFLEQPGGLNGVVGQAISKNVKEEVGALVEDAAQAEIKPLTLEDEAEANEEEELYLSGNLTG